VSPPQLASQKAVRVRVALLTTFDIIIIIIIIIIIVLKKLIIYKIIFKNVDVISIN